MKQYEYTYYYFHPNTFPSTQKMNMLGKKGWELVCIYNEFAYFKRLLIPVLK